MKWMENENHSEWSAAQKNSNISLITIHYTLFAMISVVWCTLSSYSIKTIAEKSKLVFILRIYSKKKKTEKTSNTENRSGDVNLICLIEE